VKYSAYCLRNGALCAALACQLAWQLKGALLFLLAGRYIADVLYLPRRPGDDDTPQLALATGRAPITPGVPRRLHFLVYYARDGTVPSDLWARIRLLDRIGQPANNLDDEWQLGENEHAVGDAARAANGGAALPELAQRGPPLLHDSVHYQQGNFATAAAMAASAGTCTKGGLPTTKSQWIICTPQLRLLVGGDNDSWLADPGTASARVRFEAFSWETPSSASYLGRLCTYAPGQFDADFAGVLVWIIAKEILAFVSANMVRNFEDDGETRTADSLGQRLAASAGAILGGLTKAQLLAHPLGMFGRTKPFPHEQLPECMLPQHFHRSEQQEAWKLLQQCKPRHFRILLEEEEKAGWVGEDGKPLRMAKKAVQMWSHGGSANAERRKLMERPEGEM